MLSFWKESPVGQPLAHGPHGHTCAAVMNGLHMALMVTQGETPMKAWGQITISPPPMEWRWAGPCQGQIYEAD